MPESLLRILNFFLLLLLVLFFVRVLRAVWVQINAQPYTAPPQQVPAAAPPRRVPNTAAAGGLRLKVVEPPALRGQTFPLGDEVTVGRAAGCGVALADTTVSQLHARVFRRDKQLYVEDLGSTNGTWVNRSRVSAPVPVKRGDHIQIGSTLLEVTK